MVVCVRKINKSQWPAEETLAGKTDEEILPFLKADALTSCLRTSKDELSLWTVENTSEEEITALLIPFIASILAIYEER